MLITGANGMLGKSLLKIFPQATLLNGRKDLDLTNIEETHKWFDGKHFDVIIHCAAFTDIKYCEENPEKARMLHSEVVDTLCKHCKKFIYISTNPSNNTKIYYLTKYEGEIRTLLNSPTNLVIRTNIYGKGGIVEWALNEVKNNKEINGYTEVYFNAIHVQQLSNIIKSNLHLKGLISVAGDYNLSKYNFLMMVIAYLNLNTDLIKPQPTPKSNLSINLGPSDFSCTLFEGLNHLKKDYE